MYEWAKNTQRNGTVYMDIIFAAKSAFAFKETDGNTYSDNLPLMKN